MPGDRPKLLLAVLRCMLSRSPEETPETSPFFPFSQTLCRLAELPANTPFVSPDVSQEESQKLWISLRNLVNDLFDHSACCVPPLEINSWCNSNPDLFRLFEKWGNPIMKVAKGARRTTKLTQKMVDKVLSRDEQPVNLVKREKLFDQSDREQMIFGWGIVGMAALFEKDGYLVINPSLKAAIRSLYLRACRQSKGKRHSLSARKFLLDVSDIEDNGDPDELDGLSDISGENSPVTLNHPRERDSTISSTFPTPNHADLLVTPVAGTSAPRRKANAALGTSFYAAPTLQSHKKRSIRGHNKDELIATQRRSVQRPLSSRTESSFRYHYSHDERFSSGPLPSIPNQQHRNTYEALLSLPLGNSPIRHSHGPDRAVMNMPVPLPNLGYNSSQAPADSPSRSTNTATTIAPPLATSFTTELEVCPITVHVNAAASIPYLEHMSYYKQLLLERRQREQESQVYAYICNFNMERLNEAERRHRDDMEGLARAEQHIAELEGRLRASSD